MNASMESHEPTPEFRAHLEWQIAAALRRESRFAEPVRRGWTSLRTAAVVVLAFALGSMVAVASDEAQDARQKDRLIEAISAQEATAKLRLELARAELQDARSRFEMGVGGREAVLESQQQLRAIEAIFEKLRLDRDEIIRSAAAPRDEIDAPLVGGRDFVHERLMLELQAAKGAVAAEEAALAEARRQIEVGMANRNTHLQAEVELAQALAAVKLLQGKIELRRQALKDGLRGESAARAQRALELKIRYEGVQREMEIARIRLADLRARVEIGTATPLDAKRAEVQVLEREMELQMLKRELDALRTKRE